MKWMNNWVYKSSQDLLDYRSIKRKQRGVRSGESARMRCATLQNGGKR